MPNAKCCLWLKQQWRLLKVGAAWLVPNASVGLCQMPKRRTWSLRMSNLARWPWSLHMSNPARSKHRPWSLQMSNPARLKLRPWSLQTSNHFMVSTKLWIWFLVVRIFLDCHFHISCVVILRWRIFRYVQHQPVGGRQVGWWWTSWFISWHPMVQRLFDDHYAWLPKMDQAIMTFSLPVFLGHIQPVSYNRQSRMSCGCFWSRWWTLITVYLTVRFGGCDHFHRSDILLVYLSIVFPNQGNC